MQDTAPGKKYQLRRMILINVGTNKKVPSNRITQIDPRGGASVVGPNGVGKTTTLRLIPLFFGYQPSQLISSTSGQDAMVQFVLPTDVSAIAFEYQRGSNSDEDLRLAVMRREPTDSNVPFYRIYKSGFRKEFFVNEGRFLSDAETQLQISSLGVETTGKLNSSEYRTVVLKTPSVSKNRDKLIRWSHTFSFGPKQLDSMDRLVATMVKQSVNFNDFVQVVVSQVQNDMGMSGDRSKLMFKQSAKTIDQWLIDHKACEQALKLKPEFQLLREAQEDFYKAESRLRELRGDVLALGTMRQNQVKNRQAERERLDAEWEGTVKREDAELARLQESASKLSEASVVAANAYAFALNVAAEFKDVDFAKLQIALQSLPILREDSASKAAQIRLARAGMEGIVAEFQAQIEGEKETNTKRRFTMEQDKQPHRDQHETASKSINKARDEALVSARSENKAILDELSGRKDDQLGLRGQLQQLTNAAQASEDALRAQSEVQEKHRKHEQGIAELEGAELRAKSAQNTAMHEFERQERLVDEARKALETAQALQQAAQEHATPAKGTLLAALRQSPDETWKPTLARIINPALLSRADLSPQLVDEAAATLGTLYGWTVDTQAIAAPEWADDGLAQKAVEDAQARMKGADEALAEARRVLGIKNKAVEDADFSVNVASATLSQRRNQVPELERQLAAADDRVKSERKKAKENAEKKLSEVNALIGSLTTQIRDQGSKHERELHAVNADFDKQIEMSMRQRDEAILALTKGISELEGQLKARITSLEKQRDDRLREKGVDTDFIAKLEGERQGIDNQISEISEKEPLVKRWKVWREAGGQSLVITVQRKAQDAAAAVTAAAEVVTAFELKAKEAKNSFEKRQGEDSVQISKWTSDVNELAALDEKLSSYRAGAAAPLEASVIDDTMSVKNLSVQVNEMITKRDKHDGVMSTKVVSLRSSLLAHKSSVAELVSQSLNGAETVTARAAALLLCERQIQGAVVDNIRNMLDTIMLYAGKFRKTISDFESGVDTFNKRLQNNLQDVTCFERFRGLRLLISTDFGNLDIYKKLKALDEIQKKQAFAAPTVGVLPAKEIKQAIEDFKSVLGSDGSLEVNLSSYITLEGHVVENGMPKAFHRTEELQGVSSNGLSTLVLITLLIGMLDMIRGNEPVFVPWVTDEVATFDANNFSALMQLLRDNRIDVVTGSPDLGMTQNEEFSRRYAIEDRGVIRECIDGDVDVELEVQA